MKTVYELTCHDGQTDSFTAKQFYSNFRAANESLDELKARMIHKHDIDKPSWERWTYTDGGKHQTWILNGRWSITLVVWNVSKDKSIFI
jgi:hypothetical protein